MATPVQLQTDFIRSVRRPNGSTTSVNWTRWLPTATLEAVYSLPDFNRPSAFECTDRNGTTVRLPEGAQSVIVTETGIEFSPLPRREIVGRLNGYRNPRFRRILGAIDVMIADTEVGDRSILTNTITFDQLRVLAANRTFSTVDCVQAIRDSDEHVVVPFRRPGGLARLVAPSRHI